MAEFIIPDSRRCHYFFLYDGSKVKGEGDPTREGICYFYPEETPIDQQELLCGQLAGVSRCVSELSSSPVRVLRLRRSKFAICMKGDFFWALGCSVDVPTISVCGLLDQLINLFCFYNGSVRQSYQLNSREALAARWAQYLTHLQSGPSELHHIFSCLRTIDSTNIDPLLLLKAALILQACQRCPLVLAGCILFCGRVVSTQMSPELTMNVMVQETEGYKKEPSGPSASTCLCNSVCSTAVFLNATQLQELQDVPVDREYRSHLTPDKDSFSRKTLLSRTLSNTPSTDSDQSDPHSSPSPLTAHKVSSSPHSLGPENAVFSPAPSDRTGPPQSVYLPVHYGKNSHEAEEEAVDESRYYSFHSNGVEDSLIHSEGDSSVLEETSPPDAACGTTLFDNGESGSVNQEPRGETAEAGSGGWEASAPSAHPEDGPLIPMTLYLHRVKGLVLALLVEPHFLSDSAAMEDVYHSSLASLNGLEAHLRAVAPGVPQGPSQGPYIFGHFDCIQNTLTSNLSAGAVGALERSFVRATSLLHSHFFNTETLQEAIIRSAGAAVYGTRSLAQETYFLQHGGTARNSGIPNHQDSAFSLPIKARHRLLKHGVNLL
ncbi:BLOC-3 complex member HPS4 [Genypterus blacodes]|uniref:BLOC-3 complex member HPS4 n=1 Tax=Genypterus blacodes TaxID=154954 RepID=UPI003F767A14